MLAALPAGRRGDPSAMVPDTTSTVGRFAFITVPLAGTPQTSTVSKIDRDLPPKACT